MTRTGANQPKSAIAVTPQATATVSVNVVLPRKVADSSALRAQVMAFFGNSARCELWFATPNPLLGNLSPTQLIRIGQIQRLQSFIESAVAANGSAPGQ